MKHIYTLEFWRDVKGYKGLYQVSNVGQVRSLPRHGTKGKILKPLKDTGGYLFVSLCKDGEKKFFLIHRLIAEAFLPNQEKLAEVDHINNAKTDNRVANLQWISKVENNRKKQSGIMIPRRVQCLETGEIFETVSAAAKAANRTSNAMGQHLRGLTQICAGKHFKYYDGDDVE